MNAADRQRLERRWQEIEGEIQAIHAGRVVDGSPAEREAALLQEHDEIEYLLGMADFDERAE